MNRKPPYESPQAVQAEIARLKREAEAYEADAARSRVGTSRWHLFGWLQKVTHWRA